MSRFIRRFIRLSRKNDYISVNLEIVDLRWSKQQNIIPKWMVAIIALEPTIRDSYFYLTS
jgi:hypothetical protein